MKSPAPLFKALADETRLRILALLVSGELCVCDLLVILQLPQSTVSRHLAYLRNSGLVQDRREGVWMYYRLALDTDALQVELLELLARRLPELPRIAADRVALEKRLGGGKTACN